MMKLPALVPALLVAVAACALPPPPPPVRPPTAPADPSEYEPFREPGSLTLRGQAFLTTRGGDVKVAAGRMVTLDPATSYADAWFRGLGTVADRFAMSPPDTLFSAARRTTTANAEGRFSFTGLPPGKYFVRTTVTWEVPARYGTAMQGGVVFALVSLPDVGEQEVILNEIYTGYPLLLPARNAVPKMPGTPVSGTVVVIKANAEVHVLPDPTTKVSYFMDVGAALTLQEDLGDWLKVVIGTTTGYIRKSDVRHN